MSIVYILASIGSLVCFIIVLIQLFKAKGALHGILGLICGIYTFIWGWINAKRLNITNIMLIWTVCLIGSMATGMFAGAEMSRQMQLQMEEMQRQQQAAPQQ